MSAVFFALGSALALLSVAAGAFGGHVLKPRLTTDLFEIFEVGARYHMYHALALLAVAWAYTQWPGALTAAAGWLFVAGSFSFLAASTCSASAACAGSAPSRRWAASAL